ncbi:MAG: hypothetical protein PHH09_05935, partial [Methanoregulaceae archaeon]|nr:hypothetical protein [Methanoregulaceae archaeon]
MIVLQTRRRLSGKFPFNHSAKIVSNKYIACYYIILERFCQISGDLNPIGLLRNFPQYQGKHIPAYIDSNAIGIGTSQYP